MLSRPLDTPRLRTVRTLLAGLIAGTLVPFVVFGVVMVGRTARDERAAIERRLTDSADSLADALDRDMLSTTGALEALGASAALDRGDLATFREEAARAIETQPRWAAVVLFSPDGTRLIDTRGGVASSTRSLDPESLRASVSTGRPVYGNLVLRPPRGWGSCVRVPVSRGGHVRWVLTAVTSAEAVAGLAVDRPGEDGMWLRAIVDRDGAIVAQSRDRERFVGREATRSFMGATSARTEGVYRDVAVDGARVYVAFSHAALSGWITAVVVPVAVLDEPMRRSLLGIAGFALAAAALGTAGALVASRRFARALGSVESGALALSEGERPRVDASGIVEVARIGVALVRSADLLAARAAERDEHVARAETAREEAEAANHTKDEFLAMLGHELRNPLAPITTAFHLLEQRGEGRSREHGIIRRQIAHVQRLVDDLLDVSRITRGKVELHRERVEVAAFVWKAVEMVRDLVEQRRHRLTVDVQPGLFVDGDPVRLAQVVANLLTNAARYTQPGGNVHVGAAREGELIRLRVEDDGAGLAPHLLGPIFEPFVQGPRGPDRAQGGLGLGLTLVKSFVALHGGTVEARSEGVGRGSTFSVELPAAAPARAESGRPATAPQRPAGGGLRVLVVDDNTDAVELLAELLALAGYEVRTALDGATALDVATSFRPDAAILDLGLPVMDGFELALRLRDRLAGAAPALIAVSGYGQPADRARSSAVGFRRHFVKPADMDEVLAELSAIAAHRRPPAHAAAAGS